jgi:putative peptide zinc metalloprotease protein
MYSQDTLVSVRPFTRQPEGEDVVIGRPETGVFIAIPSEAVEVLDHLAQGRTVGEAADLHRSKYGEAPDMEDFLCFLEAKGIIQPASVAGSEPSERPATGRQPVPVKYHFSSFPRTLAKRIFGRSALLGGLFMVAMAVAATIRYPSLMTGPHDLYFPDHRTLCWVLLILASYGSLFVHEFGHLVAARALGINSRLGVSHRLWYLVAETDLTALWSVPKEKRYLPLVAGTLVDIVSGAALVLLLFAQQQHWAQLSIPATRLVRAMVFTYLARAVWQCCLFIRTDFYYVIANFFNCKNLLKDTETYLRNRLALVIRSLRTVDQSGVPAAELRVVRIYAWVWIAGRIAAFFVLALVTIPLAGSYVTNLAGALRTGYSAAPSNFIDALVLSISFFIPFITGLMLWIGGMFRRERI